MKKLTVVALSLLAAGAALADGGSSAETGREAVIAARTAVKVVAPQSSRTAVVAELQRARQAGEIDALDREVDRPLVAAASSRGRGEVVAELAHARATGQLELVNGDRSDHAALAPVTRRSASLFVGQPVSLQ